MELWGPRYRARLYQTMAGTRGLRGVAVVKKNERRFSGKVGGISKKKKKISWESPTVIQETRIQTGSLGKARYEKKVERKKVPEQWYQYTESRTMRC